MDGEGFDPVKNHSKLISSAEGKKKEFEDLRRQYNELVDKEDCANCKSKDHKEGCRENLLLRLFHMQQDYYETKIASIKSAGYI